MNENNKHLVEKAKQGDNIAISELMNQYNSELFNLAKMYSSSDSDAEDALQNAYIRAFRNLSSLEDINKFDSWIKQITVNEAKRIVLSSYNQKNTMFSELDNEEDDLNYDPEDEKIENQPEMAYDKKETSEIVLSILDSLSEDQRIVALMHFYENKTLREIAEELEVPQSTVIGRIQTAKKNIKASVLEMERKDGIKLYNMAPLPFFIYLLHLAQGMPVPASLIRSIPNNPTETITPKGGPSDVIKPRGDVLTPKGSPDVLTPKGGLEGVTTTVQPVRRFDPMTGKPLGDVPQHSFDSNTGRPIDVRTPVQPVTPVTPAMPAAHVMANVVSENAVRTGTKVGITSALSKLGIGTVIGLSVLGAGYYAWDKTVSSPNGLEQSSENVSAEIDYNSNPPKAILVSVGGDEMDLMTFDDKYKFAFISAVNNVSPNSYEEVAPHITISGRMVKDNSLVSARELYYNLYSGEYSFTEYEYNDDNRVIKSLDYDSIGSNPVRIMEFEYDANGKQIKQTVYNEEGKMTFRKESEYDKNGELSKTISYDGAGKITNTEIYSADSVHSDMVDGFGQNRSIDRQIKYDNDGNRLEIINYYDSNGNITTHSESAYNKQNRPLRITNYNSDGTIMSEYKTEYDEKGREILFYRYYEEKEAIAISEIDYNEETTKTHTTYSEKGELIFEFYDDYDEVCRVITYYKNGKITHWLLYGNVSDEDLQKKKKELIEKYG